MPKTMMFSAAAALFAIVAAPLQAATPGAGGGKGGAEVQAPSPDTAKAPKKYCVVDTLSGSHIARKTCLTREEWRQRGFDPLDQ